MAVCNKQTMQLLLLLTIVCLSGNKATHQRRRVKCREPHRHRPPYRRCTGVFLCPLECRRSCVMDCNLCRPVCGCNLPGAVCQDPRFVGGDGITFYFHGRKDQDFCLLSDSNLHINAHFIGKRNPKLKRDFTWVQSIGVMFENHKLLIAARKTPTWDDNLDRLSISLDETPLSLPTEEGHNWHSDHRTKVSVSRTSSTNAVVVEVADLFKVAVNVVPITTEESRVHGYGISNDDCFAHLEVGFKFYNLSDEVDGVLGQTYGSNYRSRIEASAVMPVMGGEHKYRTRGIFDTNCLVSRFGKRMWIEIGSVARQRGLERVECSSGMEGKGLVCRR